VTQTVVLLKQGDLEAVECQPQDIFLLARIRQAGICGVFDRRHEAEAFIAKTREQQRTILATRGDDAESQEIGK
jgi:hypothetical protein